MNTYTDKTTETKSNAIANSMGARQAAAHEAFHSEDNRPEAIAQKKIQEAVNNSGRVKPLRTVQAMANAHIGKPYQQKKENKTGLPGNLKSGIENLSGYSLDDVKVHYNSENPVQLNALAYAQGTDIHIASGQERHLPHEAWHVVQQKQGRVKATMQMKEGVHVNDDNGLEQEADVTAKKALSASVQMNHHNNDVLQGKFEMRQFKISAVSHDKGCGCSSCVVQAKAKTPPIQLMKKQPVQRVIAANPVAVNQGGMIAFGGAAMDMGLTNPIAGAVVPTYNINTAPVIGGFTATVVKTTAADEGNTNAVYMQAGIYPTNLMLHAGALGPFAVGPGNRQVYGELSAANSTLSRMAEQEHLDDLRRAFQITLGIADTAIDQAVVASPHGPFATALLAQQAAENYINGRIAILAGIQGTAPFLITAGLLALYQAKEQLTAIHRDAPGLHTFDIDRVNASTSGAAIVLHLLSLLPGVPKKDIRPIIPGAAFAVPGPAAAAIIV
jgi:hypothetical protein